MQIKDHYRALGIEPSASLSEIKKAYRRLAHQFHPDKNISDPYAAAQFSAIKEAYEVLSNPTQKEIYLQKRWYYQSIGKKMTEEIVTPFSLLKQVLELDRYVSKLDVHRMDKAGLASYFGFIFSNENIEKLNSFREYSVNRDILNLALRSSKALAFSQLLPLSDQLMKLAPDEMSRDLITQYVRQSRRSDQWEKFKPWIILVIVMIICLLILQVGP